MSLIKIVSKILVIFIIIFVARSMVHFLLMFIIFVQHLTRLRKNAKLILTKVNSIVLRSNRFIKQDGTNDVVDEGFPALQIFLYGCKLWNTTIWNRVWSIWTARLPLMDDKGELQYVPREPDHRSFYSLKGIFITSTTLSNYFQII